MFSTFIKKNLKLRQYLTLEVHELNYQFDLSASRTCLFNFSTNTVSRDVTVSNVHAAIIYR